MPDITGRERTWLTAHADELSWLNGIGSAANHFPVLNYLRTWLDNHLTLTDTQTEVLGGIYRDVTNNGSWGRANSLRVETVQGTHGYDPAGAGDLSNLPNGIYEVQNGIGDLVDTYQIYTATRGELRGQRLLKYSTGGGRWSAFATILRDGRVHVWRRFANLSDEDWLTRGLRMVDQVLHHESTTSQNAMTVVYSFAERDIPWVSINTTCRKCNLAVAPALGIHTDCLAELMPVPRTTANDEPLQAWERELLQTGYVSDPDEEEDEVQPQPVGQSAMHECEYCDDEYDRIELLWRHRRNQHSEEYPHQCTRAACWGTFATLEERNTHRSTHTLRRPTRTRRLLDVPGYENTTPATPATPVVSRARMSEIDPTWLQ